mmetsp:Transcript_23370/g.79502  ORF Transcript_23370/g.79502 Transcript_23370/m.79502 type:complete len:200 (-) Transcript_23370:151-750(-)
MHRPSASHASLPSYELAHSDWDGSSSPVWSRDSTVSLDMMPGAGLHSPPAPSSSGSAHVHLGSEHSPSVALVVHSAAAETSLQVSTRGLGELPHIDLIRDSASLSPSEHSSAAASHSQGAAQLPWSCTEAHARDSWTNVSALLPLGSTKPSSTPTAGPHAPPLHAHMPPGMAPHATSPCPPMPHPKTRPAMAWTTALAA